MSYWIATEQDEVLDYGDVYIMDCPYCNKTNIERINKCRMPWDKDDELRIECPNCKKNFEIRPKLFKRDVSIRSKSHIHI